MLEIGLHPVVDSTLNSGSVAGNKEIITFLQTISRIHHARNLPIER